MYAGVCVHVRWYVCLCTLVCVFMYAGVCVHVRWCVFNTYIGGSQRPQNITNHISWSVYSKCLNYSRLNRGGGRGGLHKVLRINLKDYH